MKKPITPTEAAQGRIESIPSYVFEVFNELIVENLDMKGIATFTQDEVEKRIMGRMPQGTQFTSRWLDVESLYRASGWEVEYDKPGYNESYKATFTFRTPF
jgi:hypothetical protein